MERDSKVEIYKSIKESSVIISFLEAIMAGGRFNVDEDNKTIEFKHFKKKQKSFIISCDKIKHLQEKINTPAITLQDKIYLHFLHNYHISFWCCPNALKQTLKDKLLISQMKRFKHYTSDPLDGNESFLSEEHLQNLLSTMSPKELQRLDRFTKYSHDPSTYIQLIAARNRNRFELENALREQDCTKIAAASRKKTWLGYIPLKDKVVNFKKMNITQIDLSSFDPTLPMGEIYSFVDAIFSRRLQIDSATKTMTFKHYKHKKKTYKYQFPNGLRSNKEFSNLLDPGKIASQESLCNLLDNLARESNHRGLIKLLTITPSKQKKREIISLWREFCTRDFPHCSRIIGLYLSPGPYKEFLLERLETINPKQRNYLDGFDKDLPEEEYPLYIDKIIQRNNNREEFDNAMNNDNFDEFTRACSKPLFLCYIPFIQDCKKFESEVQHYIEQHEELPALLE